MQVPSGAPTSRIDAITPALTLISVPLWPAPRRARGAQREVRDRRDARQRLAAEARACGWRRDRRRCAILLVACRSIASRASSASIPSPSSSTRISFLPPSSTVMAMRRAPASSAFSTSSLTTEAAARRLRRPRSGWRDRAPAGGFLPISMPWIHSGLQSSRGGGRTASMPTDSATIMTDDPPELHRVAARKMRQRHVHAPHAGQDGQRHEQRGDDRSAPSSRCSTGSRPIARLASSRLVIRSWKNIDSSASRTRWSWTSRKR